MNVETQYSDKDLALFGAIFNSITDGVVFADLDRRVRMINPAFTRLMGYSQEEIEGCETRILFNKIEEFQAFGEVKGDLGESGESRLFEFECRRRDGSVFMSETLAAPVSDNEGTLLGFLGIIRDITDRNAMAEEIMASRKRLEIIVQLNEMVEAPEIEIIQFCLENAVHLAGSRVGYFHFVSEGRQDIDLYAWSEEVGQDCKVRGGKKYPLNEAGLWADCIRTGKPVLHNDYHLEPNRKGLPDGHMHITRHMGIPLYEETGMTAILGVGNKERPYTDFDAQQLQLLGQELIRLIMRKRELKEKRNLQARLQYANKVEALGTLAGGIAHDFNNILGIIHGNADMALEDMTEKDLSRKNMQRVLQACERAKDIIRQILIYSRREEVRPEPFNPCELIRDTLSMVEASVLKAVEIKEELCSEPITVMADKSQFQQVLMNLFVNAMQAMPGKGTVTVSGGKMYLDCEHDENELEIPAGVYFCLGVADNGAGMDEATKSRIFDPFFTTRKAIDGTGMGLSIVSGIVENHEGLIRVDSKPGEGTVFRVYFPLTDEKAMPVDFEKRGVKRGSERILLVDDEEMMAEVGMMMLRRLGYEVTSMTSSLEALELFQSGPNAFDMVVTDQMMPNLNGTELSAELLKIRPDLPIILCSGFTKITPEEAREVGVRMFLDKPLDKKTLGRAIRKVFDSDTAE